MNNNLTITNQNSKLVLEKSKCLLDISNKLLLKKEYKKIWEDTDTNLIWQVNVDVNRYDWNETFKYVNKLNKNIYAGYNNWRIPTIEELKSVISKEHNMFKKIKKYYIKSFLLDSLAENNLFAYYWSSTENSSDIALAGYVNFKNGSDGWADKSGKAYIRCVRFKDDGFVIH